MKSHPFARSLFVATVFAVVTSPLAAQVISVDQGSVLAAGSSAKVSFSDPSMAGQSVTVTVTGGFPVPTTEQLTITLNEHGEGSVAWTVATNWRTATFNGPNAVEVACVIR